MQCEVFPAVPDFRKTQNTLVLVTAGFCPNFHSTHAILVSVLLLAFALHHRLAAAAVNKTAQDPCSTQQQQDWHHGGFRSSARPVCMMTQNHQHHLPTFTARDACSCGHPAASSDEYMNLVLTRRRRHIPKKGIKKPSGATLLKGDSISLIQQAVQIAPA
jgi:hypothetical protein